MREEERQEEAARWLPFVQAFVEAYEQGLGISCGEGLVVEERVAPTLPGPGQQRPTVVLCSPHPDDEVLTGALALRLRQEQGARVVNLAVTLGSNPARQAARWQELLAACARVGFECQRLPSQPGFDLKAGAGGKGWSAAVQSLVGIFEDLGPDFVLFPHLQDHHPAHVETSRLVNAALARFTEHGGNTVKAVETEYWRPMTAPNLLVGVSALDLSLLLAAVACHRGEIARNPYHLTYPARLMDSVRRGTELVSDHGVVSEVSLCPPSCKRLQGAADARNRPASYSPLCKQADDSVQYPLEGYKADAVSCDRLPELVRATTMARPGFLFGELYRLSIWRRGRRRTLALKDGWLGPGQGLERLLEKEQE